MDPTFLILLLGAGVLFMFLMQRPMRKQAAAQAKMRDELQPGTRVMLNSGMFGTIKHVANTQAVIELAPGVEVTMLKASVNKALDGAEEEFEYDDDTAHEAAVGDVFDQQMAEDGFFAMDDRVADEPVALDEEQPFQPGVEPNSDPGPVDIDSVTNESHTDDTEQRPGN